MRRSQNGDWYAAKTLPKESLTHFAILSQYFSILSKIPQNAQKISVKAMNIPTAKFKICKSGRRIVCVCSFERFSLLFDNCIYNPYIYLNL